MIEVIEKMIEEAIRKEERERVEGVYYPSELPFCLRRNYFLYKVKKEVSLPVLKIFELGNMLHSWFSKVFERAGVLDRSEEKMVYHDGLITIKGRCDDIIKLKKSGKRILLEIKTVRNLRFIKEPKREHAMQLSFYMFALGFKKAYLVYVDRRDLRIRVFTVSFDESLFNELVERAHLLDSFVKNNEKPPKTSKKWMCNYCQYRWECEGDY